MTMGLDRRSMCALLKVSPNTPKTHVRRMLERCGGTSLKEVGRALQLERGPYSEMKALQLERDPYSEMGDR